MVKVSIIIPIYNAAKYLRQCMDSLLQQTYSDFEIICVDDESTDESYTILKEYEKQDERIRVAVQKNQYAGVARNNGIKLATGKYLLFLDADDFFCEDMLEQLVSKAEEDKADILAFDAYEYDEQSQKITEKNFLRSYLFGEGVKSAEDIAEHIFEFVTPAPWNKFFLRKFVMEHQLEFQKLRKTNDLYFVYSALTYAKRISVLDKKMLYYRINNADSLQGMRESSAEIYAGKALNALYERLLESGHLEQFWNSFKRMAMNILVYNIGKVNGTSVFVAHCNGLRMMMLDKLRFSETIIQSEFLNGIYKNENMIIYGAGKIGKTVINILRLLHGYEKSNLIVAVSKVQGNPLEIDGVKVLELLSIPQDDRKQLVLVANADDKTACRMLEYARSNGFDRVTRISDEEILRSIWM